MTANNLILPTSATAAVIAEVTRFGIESLETGGFLLAPRDANTITTVAHVGTAGIVRRRNLFQVSEVALDRLFAHADQHEFWIPVQFHSHGRAAFMSPTDVDHGLSVEGFVTTIVPYFATPPADPSQWGWWRYDDAWTPIAPPRTTTGTSSIITFDEDGIRGA
jgi:hypothetical protein